MYVRNNSPETRTHINKPSKYITPVLQIERNNRTGT